MSVGDPHAELESYNDAMRERQERIMLEIEAHVSDNGEGDKVTVLMPPEMRQYQFVNISADDARVLAAKLTRAAKLAEANAANNSIDDL